MLTGSNMLSLPARVPQVRTSSTQLSANGSGQVASQAREDSLTCLRGIIMAAASRALSHVGSDAHLYRRPGGWWTGASLMRLVSGAKWNTVCAYVVYVVYVVYSGYFLDT